MVEDDRRAAMGGDGPPPVHLRANYLHESMRERVRIITVGLDSLEDSSSVNYHRSTAVPCPYVADLWGSLTTGPRVLVSVVLGFDISFPDFCANFGN